MPDKVTVHRKQRVFDDVFAIDEAELSYERFDGTMSPKVRRLSFERGDSVAALLYNRETKTILLVNQFKYPAWEKGPGWITEVVAGMLEGDESPESALRREVLEESGWKIERLEPIATFYVSPGGSSERIHLFYAEVTDRGRVAPGGGRAEENEDIARVEIPRARLGEVIESGEIADAKTLLGLLWLERRLAADARQSP